MKKRLMLVVVLVFIFLLMVTGCGNSNSAEKEPIEADGQMTENETGEIFTIEGTVLEVNETDILINESGYENGECYLIISDVTVIYVDGEKTDISMIKAGQTIKAMYTGEIEETYPSRIKDVKEIIAANNSSESDQSLSDYSVVIGDLMIALYESKQDITARLDETDLSYNEYDSYYMIDEALCVYFEDDICVRLSFLNEVPQTARGIHKNDSYSQLIEQYGESFEKHTYTGKELYDIYRYSSNKYICEFGILPEISDAIYNIEIYSPKQYPIYDYGEELEQNNYQFLFD